jgi:predicted kinase
MHQIIIIRGAPGVGKSTLVRRLKSKFKNGVTIEIGNMLKLINNFEDGNSKQYLDTLENARILCLNYLKAGYAPILLVGPFKAARMRNYLTGKLDKDVSYLVITLLATNHTDLSDRIDGREIGFKDKSISYIVNEDMLNYEIGNEIRYDTSGKSPEEIFLFVAGHLHFD